MNNKKRGVVLLGLVSLLTDASSEIISPILPLFITSLGGGGIAIGLIAGLSDSVTSILKVISGYYSDKLGKRKTLVSLGYTISAFAKLIFPFSTTWKHIFVLRPIERVGKGIRESPRDALIASYTNKKTRGEWFGIHRAFDSTGAIIGSVIAFILITRGLSYKSVLFIASGIAFFALIPFLFIKEPKKKPLKKLKFNIDLLPKKLRKTILILTIFAFANISYMFFLLKTKSSLGDSIALVLILYVIFNIFYAIFSVPAGILSDKFGRKKIIFSGFILFSAISLGFIFLNSLIGLIILFIFYGLSNALIDSTQRAYISDLSKPELKGVALGTFHTLTGIVALPSSLIAGVLWSVNPSITFIFSSLVALLASLMIIKK